MNEQSEPRHYEIRVRGVLGDGLLAAFPGLVARRQRHETLLTGDLPDQAALHGVIGRIESLGLELLEIRRVRSRSLPSSSASRRSTVNPAGAAPPRRSRPR